MPHLTLMDAESRMADKPKMRRGWTRSKNSDPIIRKTVDKASEAISGMKGKKALTYTSMKKD